MSTIWVDDMYAEWLWKCSKVGNKCNTYAVCRMFHVNKFDLLTANCWCKCRNLLMRKRDMICRVKILERKKNSRPNGFKKTYICVTRKIKTKVASIHFSFFPFVYVYFVKRMLPWSLMFIHNSKSESQRNREKKLCGLLLELTWTHWCHHHKSKHLFHALNAVQIYGILIRYFDRLDLSFGDNTSTTTIHLQTNCKREKKINPV